MLKSDALIRENDGRVLTIIGRDKKEVKISPDMFSYKESLKEGEKINQNQFLWPIYFFTNHNYTPEYNYTYKEQELIDVLTKSSLFTDAKEPQDAKLVEKDNKYVIEEEKEGTVLDQKKTVESVKKAYLEGKDQLVLDEEYIKPKITKDDPNLLKKKDDVNKLLTLKITYDFGETKEELSGDKILDLYKFDGDNFTPIHSQVYEYLRQLAIKYDTYSPKQERNFKTSSGEDVKVVGGIYGWQMDVEESTNELIDTLNKFESKELVPKYLMEGYTRGLNDIGDTYIEISIDRQHLWFYKHGKLITETDVVTGNPSLGVSTPKGTWKVWSVEKDRSLVGIVPQGTADYSSPVDFWMPINWEGVGIHNSRWRKEFGGNIYQSNGSYGCVNLPYDPCKTIYENMEVNIPVVIY